MRVTTPSIFLALIIAQPSLASTVWDARELAVLDITNQQRSFHNLAPLNGDNRLHEAAYGHSESMAVYDFFSHTTLAGPNALTGGQRILDAGYIWNSPGPGQIGAWGENIAGGYGSDGPFEYQALDAARDVMYGTTSLSALSTYDVGLGGTGFDSWDEVGRTWRDSDWSTWGAGWMGSIDHRGNILNDTFTDLGVGYFFQLNDSGLLLTDLGQESSFPLRTYWTQNFAAGDTDFNQVVPIPAGIWLFGSALAVGIGAVRRKAYRPPDT